MKHIAKQNVDLDSILTEIGQFGKYQLINVILYMIPSMFAATLASEYIFTARDVPYRCFIPECEHNLSIAVYQTDWLNITIPNGQKCVRYAPLGNPSVSGDLCNRENFNFSSTVSCDEYVYAEAGSMIEEFNIPCQDWKRSMIGTTFNVAYLLVLPVVGFVSDRFGRKAVLIVTAFITGLALILRSYSTSYAMYLAITFVGSFIGAGSFSACHLMAAELFHKDIRAISSVIISIAFCFGHIAIGLAAWAFPSWRMISRVLAYPQLLVVLYVFILNESIRWLLSAGQIEKAEKALRGAAAMNGNQLSQKSLDKLAGVDMDSPSGVAETEPKKVTNKSLLRQVLGSRIILRRLCITPIWWISITLVYYGLSINSVSLYGNIYANFVLVASVEIPGYLAGFYGMNLIGRKISLCSAFAICSLANLAFPFLPSEHPSLQLVVYLIGKLFISMAVATVYQYTMELYPTELRHSFLAFSSMIGRIGSILAPQTPLLVTYWAPLPSVIFGSLAMVSALTALTTPETLGKKLPDYVTDAENIKNNIEIEKL